jgi:hypothetical protein
MITVDDLIKILDTEGNRYGGATGKPRMLNLSLNGNFAGSIESVKLDGYGDGLITDVTMEITSSKFTTTNADRIRNMSDEELAEWLTNMCDIERHEEPYKSIYNLDTGQEEEIHDSYGDLLKWLQSEAE